MSGGRLVVLDRLGRDVKPYPLPSGLVTLGRDRDCDICILLSSVCSHHATIVVHANQTVIRNVSDGETLVNGQSVSVAALSHNDIITIGDRSLRWEYNNPAARRPLAPEPALRVPTRGARRPREPRRATAGGGAAPRSKHLQLAIEMRHRASMPGNAGGKQVAVVQPQRRDTNGQNGTSAQSAQQGVPAHTTQATLWIESRKRRSTPLRVAALRNAQGARRLTVTKIQAPLKIDHTKQAAIMLMTGHTPKTKITPKQTKKTPAYVVKRPSPAPRAARPSRPSTAPHGYGATPSRGTTYNNSSRRASRGAQSSAQSISVLEITDSDATNASMASRRSRFSPQSSPLLPSPRKSALKDPTAKKSFRKSESIKFDLSNLEDHSNDILSDSTHGRSQIASEDDLTLHYSDASNTQSPSPRRSIHSRSSKILEKLGTSVQSHMERSTLTPESPRGRKSLRGSMMVQKALETPGNNTTGYSSRTKTMSDKTVSDKSWDTTAESAFKTRTLSPRASGRNLESYSIVDLVSINSNESTKSSSVYDSIGSTRSSSIVFKTPQNSGRKTRSTIEPNLLSSSTPYVQKSRATRSSSNPNISRKSTPNKSTSFVASKRSKSLSTPDNTQKNISFNSTRISRASRTKSRGNDSDLQFISSRFEDDDDSPKTSRRPSRANKTLNSPNLNKSSPQNKRQSRKNLTIDTSLAVQDGMITPDSRHSPEEVGTPVLSIQSLLDSSQGSLASKSSGRKNKRAMSKRKTIGVIRSERKKTRSSIKSKSLNLSARNLRLSKDSGESDKTDENCPRPDNEDTVTPTSSVKLVPEAVKNKHSTAKKPQSKRSIIDNLNESDIVKQLFNSPVKRKLSQSMTEFSRNQLLEDDDVVPRRPTRNTVPLTGRMSGNSLLSQAGQLTPEIFVSPLTTPGNSPHLTGIKSLFKKNTPENDLRNITGVKSLLKTPRTRKSIQSDLTKVSSVKNIFAKSPRIRLSDVRLKDIFAKSPRNDLRRVSGVKSLFQSEKKRKSPKNDLSDVRGVRSLYTRKSVANDLRNVSGVKKILRATSPTNDLTDVRGVRLIFKQKKQQNYNDVSGIEELFNESNASHKDRDTIFDQLVGKPRTKAVYSKSFLNRRPSKPKTRKAKSLHDSIDLITNNVEEWLERELQKRVQKKSLDKSSVARELQKLVTDTVEGGAPIRTSRVRNSTISKLEVTERKKSASEIYSAHTLPIKKRSLTHPAPAPALPIKKRAVLHSTPVKAARPDATMNASDLCRLSPITVADNTHLNIDTIRSTQLIATLKPKGRRTTRVQNIINDETVERQVSTLESRARRTKPKELDNLEMNASQLPKQIKRATRGKPATQNQEMVAERKTRRTRNNTDKKDIQEKKDSPKPKGKTRKTTEKLTQELVASPKLKGRTRNNTEKQEIQEKKDSPKPKGRTRKTAEKLTQDLVVSPKPKGRTRNNTEKQERKDSPKSKGKTRNNTKKQEVQKEMPSPKRKGRTRNNPEDQEQMASPKPKGRRKMIEKPEIQQQNDSPKAIGRTRNTGNKEGQDSPSAKGKRNTRAKNKEQKVEGKPATSPKKTRASKPKVQSPDLSTKSRRNKTTNTEANTRKGRPSLVIAKKPPAMKPEGLDTSQVVSDKGSPKKARSTRRLQVNVAENKTPKKTRATVTKNSVIVGKPSPQLKPQGSKTRVKKADEPATKEKLPKKRARENEPAAPEPKRANKRELSVVTQPRSNRRNKVDSPDPVPELPVRRKRKADEQTVVSPKVTRTRGKEVKSPRGKKAARKVEEAEVAEKPTRSRAKVGQRGKAEEAKPVRARKAAAAPAAAVVASVPGTSRKRKTNASASPARAVKRARGGGGAAAGRARGGLTHDTQKSQTQAAAPGRSRRR